MSDALEALRAGGALAGEYNAVFAAVFAAVAAMLLARAGGVGGLISGIAVLLVGWLIGDGMRTIAWARDLADGSGTLLPESPLWANVTAIVVWGAGSLAVGYALPAWAGAFVGRRVTWGTGWIAAAAVSASFSATVLMLVRALP